MKRADARERGEGRRGRRFVGEVLADLERAESAPVSPRSRPAGEETSRSWRAVPLGGGSGPSRGAPLGARSRRSSRLTLSRSVAAQCAPRKTSENGRGP